MIRKPYHRSRERMALAHAGSATAEDAVRRLALRCGLMLPGERGRVTALDEPGVYELRAGSARWRIDMGTQDFTVL